ncbi:hypothetical protein BGZ76_011569 [Entomortierella beljakovae]|nr:hypothetical protein BGZ76_011569 [Entomortierella beljakovae]
MLAYHKIVDRTLGKNVSATLQDIASGNVVVDYDDRKPVVDALMRDLKEGGVAKNWNERERVLALQALKTLGRATEGCDSIFTDEGFLTLIYHSGLSKTTEANIDTTASKEALKCLANALLLKPQTRKIFERLEGHGKCSLLIKVLKTQLTRPPDYTMFDQTMVLSEALKYLFNLMIVDPTIGRSEEALFTDKEKTAASGKRFQSLLPTIVSILTTIPPPSPNPLEPPHSHAIHVLLNFPISSSSLLINRTQQGDLLNVLTRMLDDTLKHSLNTDEEASTAGMSNGTELDEIVPPLVIVLTNIASSGKEAKAYVKSKLLPDNIGVVAVQTKPKQETFVPYITTQRKDRFDKSSGTSTSANRSLGTGVSRWFTAILTNYVGYGNAAGFLLNRKLGVPSSVSGATVEEIDDDDEEEIDTKTPSAATSPSASQPPINPITGAYYPDPSAYRTAMADMTEEEKEEEAGRLLDMFDKMRRTGVMDVRNPALEAGLRQREKDRYYDEQERREQEEEEELERIYGKV